MTKAVWNGVTLAESDDIALVEGNAYFPAEALNAEYFRAGSATRDTYCHWKGTATYRDVVVDGAVGVLPNPFTTDDLLASIDVALPQSLTR